MENKRYDCVVIGAGPAGLSASLFLVRYLRNTLTFQGVYAAGDITPKSQLAVVAAAEGAMAAIHIHHSLLSQQ